MRKIRINLYSKEFQPKLVILSLKHMIVAWILTAVVMALWVNVSNADHKKLSDKEKSMSQEIDDLGDELAQTQVIVSSLRLDTSLEAQVQQVRKLVSGKRELKSYLNGSMNAGSSGFSGFMKSLAAIKNDGIAITGFSIEDGMVDIEGVARNANDVPKWLGQFQNYPALSGIAFGSVKLNYNRDDNYLGFSLKSKIKEEKEDETAVKGRR
ncbi:PilN domain-containing protein [uncultured Ruminobacter sp.]|uniref:PilN domain-containing protein n=1 Tax=Ruminobacter sp. TaxID=2774296 RepID=UPI0025EBB02A|nr:PilN domain-containing protein [uncultured Ruminobacter sp.]